MSKRRKSFLLIVILFATVLLLLSFWVIRQNSNKPSEVLMIHNVVVSTELDDKLRLTGTVSRFPHGSRQVFLRFDYSKAIDDSKVKILWFLGEKLVQADTYKLFASSGSKVYCLVRENGQPLPRGPYSLGILSNSERLFDFRFEIY
ncbi:MAG: hypothetical protein LBS00_09195 [Synergistaceae bacterium]|jgi:hypothetical protein|nr:hypothetical protein [Synergistaceae bacterium]